MRFFLAACLLIPLTISPAVYSQSGRGRAKSTLPKSTESTQTQPAPVREVRKIEGIVAAVTGGGDIVYARQTEVFLIKADLPNRDLDLINRLIGVELDAEIASLKQHGSEKISKLDGLLAVGKYMEVLLKQLRQEEEVFKDGPRYYLGKTNLGGQFSFEVPPGKYYLYCLGNAGLNLAVWIELVDVTQGNQSNLELAKPLFSVLTVP